MRGPTITVRRRLPIAFALAGALALHSAPARAQDRITSPKEQFGFNIGDDYKLANYTQFEQYWRKLAAQSNRMSSSRSGSRPRDAHS